MVRHIVLLLLLSLWVPCTSGATIFKIATMAPDGSLWMTEMRRAADEIARNSDGRVKLRFYPGGVMGNDNSVLRKIHIGQLHGGGLTAGGLAGVYPDLQVYNMPFYFRSYAEVDYVRKRMDPLLTAGLRDKGFASFGFSEAGFAYLMANHPIASIDDLSGHKVWVPEGDIIARSAFEASGVSPVPLPLADVLTGLQTDLIDTISSTPTGAIALQWHTRVKHINDTPLMYVFGTLVLQQRAFERLSLQDQAVVSKAISTSVTTLNTRIRADNAAARQALADQGINFIHSTEQDRRNWQTPVHAAMHKLAADGAFSADLLDTLNDHLNHYRNQDRVKP